MPTPTVAAGASGPTEPRPRRSTTSPHRRLPPTTTRDTRRATSAVERMLAGLTELDRWLDDRMRTGLADPALARYSTWDDLAARLVDAQAGSLANRIRRLAGLVGASATWHDDVLAELGAAAPAVPGGSSPASLPGPLADAVATTVGWQVRRADVLGGVPDTDHWVVAGRSDQREDRIEVRRHWLRGAAERSLGAGPVVRGVSAEPRHVARGRHHRPRRPASLPGPGAAGARRTAPPRPVDDDLPG